MEIEIAPSFVDYWKSCSQEDIDDLIAATGQLIAKGKSQEELAAKIVEAGWDSHFAAWYSAEAVRLGVAPTLTLPKPVEAPPPPVMAAEPNQPAQYAPTLPLLPGTLVPDDQCTKCRTVYSGKLARHGSFGLRKFACPQCGFENIVPLPNSTRYTYWGCLSIFGAISIVSLAMGYVTFPGIIVILVGIGIAQDIATRNKRKVPPA